MTDDGPDQALANEHMCRRVVEEPPDKGRTWQLVALQLIAAFLLQAKSISRQEQLIGLSLGLLLWAALELWHGVLVASRRLLVLAVVALFSVAASCVEHQFQHEALALAALSSGAAVVASSCMSSARSETTGGLGVVLISGTGLVMKASLGVLCAGAAIAAAGPAGGSTLSSPGDTPVLWLTLQALMVLLLAVTPLLSAATTSKHGLTWCTSQHAKLHGGAALHLASQRCVLLPGRVAILGAGSLPRDAARVAGVRFAIGLAEALTAGDVVLPSDPATIDEKCADKACTTSEASAHTRSVRQGGNLSEGSGESAELDGASAPSSRGADAVELRSGLTDAETAGAEAGRSSSTRSRQVVAHADQLTSEEVMPASRDEPTGHAGAWVQPQLMAVAMGLRTAASGLAHDMKNPLTLVVAMSDILSKNEQIPAACQNQLKSMQTCAHHLLVMINNMRDSLWLLSGYLDWHPATVSIAAMLEQTLAVMQGIVRPAVTVTIDVPRAATCAFDEDRMKRVCHILLANAVKYTTRGSVRVTLEEAGGFVRLVFCDTGSGVMPKTLAAFARGGEAPQSALSVGLRYVARVARVAGGWLEVRNNGTGRGAGCTVTLAVPSRPVEPQWRPTVVLPGGRSSLDDLTSAELEEVAETSGAVYGGPAPARAGHACLSSGESAGALVSAPVTADAALLKKQSEEAAAPAPAVTPPVTNPARSASGVELASHEMLVQEKSLTLGPEAVKWMDNLVQSAAKAAMGPVTPQEREQRLQDVLREPRPSTDSSLFRNTLEETDSFRHGDYSVLVVDDDVSNLNMLQGLLEQQGYRTHIAASGFEALETFAECNPKPDCVLLDVTLPDISGHEVCAKLGQMAPGLAVPVIMISGKNETQDVIRGLKKGALDYITKPFQSAEVLARLESILRFHTADVQHLRASAKQVMEMVRMVFPKHVADLLQNGHRLVLENISDIAVLAVRVVNFRHMCAAVPMAQVVEKVGRLYAEFDDVVASCGAEKLDVFADSYMVYAAPPPDSTEVEVDAAVAKLEQVAQAMFAWTEDMCSSGIIKIELSMGLHMGPAVGAVLGVRRPKYTLFGSAVDVAVSLQRFALPNGALLSADAAHRLRGVGGGACMPCPRVHVEPYGLVQPFALPCGSCGDMAAGNFAQPQSEPAPPGPQPQPTSAIASVEHSASTATWPTSRPQSHDSGDGQLEAFLQSAGLSHYIEVLCRQGVSLDSLMHMSAADLHAVGVVTSTAVRRILQASEKYSSRT